MSNLVAYNKYVEQIMENARHIKEYALHPALDENTGKFIEDPKLRKERLTQAAGQSHCIFEGLGQSAPMVLTDVSEAIRGYVYTHGRLPSDELLASGFQAVQNTYDLYDGKGKPGGIFESVDAMSDTDGVLKRERQVALVFPLMLTMITGDICSWIPGNFNQAELFKIERRAGSTFGDLTKDDLIDPRTFNGQYSSFDQRHAVSDGDGTEVGGAGSTTANYFQFDSATAFGAVQPFKKKSIKVFYEHSVVAKDDGSGNLHGTFTNDAGVATTVTGTVNYATGTVDPIFSVAPEAGKKVDTGMDIDIEKDPTLIPILDHSMDSATLYPHESALTTAVTLQAYFEARREFSVDQRSMLLRGITNLLAADKDRMILKSLYYYSDGEISWSRKVPTGAAYNKFQHYETLKEELLRADHLIMQKTGDSGLVGMVVPQASAIIVQSCPGFTPAPGYRPQAQPHYLGRLWDRWDVKVDPQRTDDSGYRCLLYGKGSDSPGRAAYVTGVAIPPMTFQHPVLTSLKYQQTIWSQDYRDICPFNNGQDGRNYLMDLLITNT